MNDTRDIERLLAAWLADSALDGAPDEAIENAITTTSQQRPRPAWLTMLRTPPMTTQRHPLVGSPTARLVYLASVLLLATAIATAGLLAGAQLVARAEEPAAANGLIAFDSEGDIWVADPDGSNVRRLTETPEAERAPVWSPDGHRIAYLVASETGEDLVHVDATGGDRIVAAQGLVAPTFTPQGWSPDGARIAYSTTIEGGTSRVFVALADGSGTVRVGDPDLLARDPAWSPDGRSIAFHGGSATVEPVEPTDLPRRGTYVMDADGANARLISKVTGATDHSFSMPAWSSDGSQIVTLAGTTHASDIWVFRADGEGEIRVSDDGDNLWPTWSPDARWIGWSHLAATGVRAAFASPNGSDVRMLDEPAIDLWEPVWSPDGTRVILHLGPFQAGSDLGIIDPEGEAEMIVIPATSPGSVSWQRLSE